MLWIFGFIGGGRDCIEIDVGEEYDGGGVEDVVLVEFIWYVGVFWDEWLLVGWVDVGCVDVDE